VQIEFSRLDEIGDDDVDDEPDLDEEREEDEE
jgi:hypothetical protein